MSQRIERLAENVTFANDHQRFLWLQSHVEEIAEPYVHPVGPIREMLAHYAAQAAERSAEWIAAAIALGAALPDPDDQLYGLLIAAEFWQLGQRYPLPEMTRFLERLRTMRARAEDTDDAAQNAYQLYEELVNVVCNVESMLNGDLDNGETVASEWSERSETLANALELLYRAMDDIVDGPEDAKSRETDTERLDALVERSGNFLWACFHAEANGIPLEELAGFVRTYPDSWTGILNDMLLENVLVPGTLVVLCETEATAEQVLADAAEAISLYRSDPPKDMTLLEYLDFCLTADTLDA